LWRSQMRLHQVLVSPSLEDLYFYGSRKLAKFHILTPQKSDSIVLKTTKTACVTYVHKFIKNTEIVFKNLKKLNCILYACMNLHSKFQVHPIFFEIVMAQNEVHIKGVT